MDGPDHINQLRQFRAEIYSSFEHRQDSCMDLLDALCASPRATSVVELSLDPLFRRGYSALYSAIDAISDDTTTIACAPTDSDSEFCRSTEASFPQAWRAAIAPTVPAPQQCPYWLFGVDVTPVSRCHALTLKDRQFIHQSTAVNGQKPITIGHQYSLLAAIPESPVAESSSWIVPLEVEHVTSFDTRTQVGQTQVERVLEDQSMPWHGQLCVVVADSDYSHGEFLLPFAEADHQVVITRCRSNRVFFRLPDPEHKPRRGRHWYGQRFELQDEDTWGEPDECEMFSTTTARGKQRTITVRRWNDLLMRGSKQCPMHKHPFDLVQVQITDANGKLVFKPQWLLVFGPPRRQLSAQQVQQAYAQRFKLEHGIRFCKQHLLMARSQTPDVQREQAWVQFAWLAYAQLWVARLLTNQLPHPWQKYLPAAKQQRITPTAVKRDFYRIIGQIGTPADASKPRGKASGRKLGHTVAPRPRRLVVKRTRANPKRLNKPLSFPLI